MWNINGLIDNDVTHNLVGIILQLMVMWVLITVNICVVGCAVNNDLLLIHWVDVTVKWNNGMKMSLYWLTFFLYTCVFTFINDCLSRRWEWLPQAKKATFEGVMYNDPPVPVHSVLALHLPWFHWLFHTTPWNYTSVYHTLWYCLLLL